MKRIIKAQNIKIEYKLKRSERAKRLTLKLTYNGCLTAVAPLKLPLYQIYNFVCLKANWILSRQAHFKKNPRINLTPIKKSEQGKYKLQAYELILNKIEKWNRFYNFNYNKITIKDTKTRWGSCSSEKNLNFSYKLIFLPNEVIDYIVIHELCHLKEMNHSSSFWKLVSLTVPNYKEIKKKLKQFIT